MTETAQLEAKVAKLIKEHVGVGYTLGDDGTVDPKTIFLAPHGAAHVIVHELKKVVEAIAVLAAGKQ